MEYIAIGGLGLDHGQLQVRTFWTPQYRIVLSWELLAWIQMLGWDGIPSSFTKFITTLELSGPFHITTDIYHTQITEYSLGTILRNYTK